MADAGANKDKMAEVMGKASKQAEEAGAKASTETFNGLTLHILREAPDDKAKEKDQEKGGDKNPDVSVTWTQSESVFYVTVGTPGSDLDVIKDLTAHREGRDNALAASGFIPPIGSCGCAFTECGRGSSAPWYSSNRRRWSNGIAKAFGSTGGGDHAVPDAPRRAPKSGP